MRIGRVLQQLRTSLDISTAELCRRTEFNKGYLYRLENDLISPTLNSLEKYACALDKTVSELIKIAETEPTTKEHPYSYIPWGYVADSGYDGDESENTTSNTKDNDICDDTN